MSVSDEQYLKHNSCSFSPLLKVYSYIIVDSVFEIKQK